MSCMVESVMLNDKGKVRPNNEDNFCYLGESLTAENREEGYARSTVSDARVQRFAIMDGMGGGQAGEEASLVAAQGMAQLLEHTDTLLDAERVAQGVQTISDEIWRRTGRNGGQSGTTLAMLSLSYDCARTYHVGDSRVYMMRRNCLRRLTEDHSEIQRMLSMGMLSEKEARTHLRRHVISQYLGMNPDKIRLSVGVGQPIALYAGDCFLVCSDGLTDMMTDAQIESALKKGGSVRQMGQRLLADALNAGGADNITLCLARVQSVEPGREGKDLRKKCGLALSALLLSLIGALFSVLTLTGVL